ncbi:MAG: flagellar hook-basal body complex protein FliE [Lachnospiraceae bacterium]|nr:flagellar hook-basal body complex protein FliE [Lachnospiraceae bacterium]
MDISSLLNVNSADLFEAASKVTSGITDPRKTEEETGGFGSLLDTAIKNFNLTNSYISDKEDMELKWAMGEVDNPHDLTIALSKASQALNYTVAIRDRLLDAYKEIMQMQI